MDVTLIVDFSRVLIFSHDEVESLNAHHNYLSAHVKDYRVLDHFYLNDELLSLLDGVKSTVHVYLFSDSSLHRLPEIRARLDRTFRQIISADESGFKKSDPNAYTWLLSHVKARPEATIFLDDKADNVSAAAAVGIHAIQFINNEQALPQIQAQLERISRAE